MDIQPPVILLVSANERVDPSRHLRNLSAEIYRIGDALKPAEQEGLCRVLFRLNAGADQIFDVLQDARYRHRIAVLHYAGHADGNTLLLESPSGAPGPAGAAGLAAVLGEQRGLKLVFLNGCATTPQAEGLVAARCPAVIATSQAIDDGAAMEFAARFYAGLAGGASLASAFNEAGGAVRTITGGDPRGLYWGGEGMPAAALDPWPWALCPSADTAGEAHQWTLRGIAKDPLFGLPELPDDIVLPQSGPFLGLARFEREHARVFFGRAAEVRTLYDLVTAPDSDRILLLYGQSGVGKSSLLAAGLRPRLEASHRVAYLRRDPRRGLLGTLLQPLDTGAGPSEQAWRRTEEAEGRPLLMILDQAEEVFTQPAADGGNELGEFVHALRGMLASPDTRPRGRLILGFRKEWLPEFEERLRERHLNWGQLFLKGLAAEGVVEAVTGVTRVERLRRKYQLEVNEGLAVEIADDLLGDPESPVAPTLQVLLTKLWDEAKKKNSEHPSFTREIYHELQKKGILLGDFLDQQLAALAKVLAQEVQSGLALDLLACHTTPRGTAGQYLEAELLNRYLHVGACIPELLRRLKDGYVLADIYTEQAPIKGSRLAHDTLAPLVRERFEASDKPGQRARRILESRAVDWQDGQTGPVLDGPDLAVVEAGVSGMRSTTADEARLIRKSRRARNWRRALYGLTVLGVLVAAALVLVQWQRAESQKRTAIARLALSRAVAERDKHPIRALLLAAESVKRPLEADGILLGEAESVLREMIATTGGTPLEGGGSAAFDPQGHWLATGSVNGTVRLWDLQHPGSEPRMLQGHEGGITTVAFDPNGRWLATGSIDKTVRLWDLQHPESEPPVLLWDLRHPESEPQLRRGPAGWIKTLAFDSQGRWVATISYDGNALLWDLERSEARMLRGQEDSISTLAFDPHGRWLATGSMDETVRLWDLQHPDSAPRLLGGYEDKTCGPVYDRQSALAFDPQGRWLATESGDQTVRWWDLQHPDAAPRVLRGQEEWISPLASSRCQSALAFDPQGRWFVATGSDDRTARLWDLQHPDAEPRVLGGSGDSFGTVAVDPQGRWLAAGNRNDTVRLWDLDQPESAPRLVAAGQENVTYEEPLALAFNAQGRWLAVGSHDGVVRLLDTRNPESEARVLLGHESSIITLAFDPQGRWLVTGDSDLRTRRWDLDHPESEPRVLDGHEHVVETLAFDPRGRWLAAGSDYGPVSVWDLQHPQSAPRVLSGEGPLAFAPQSGQLATGNMDGTVSFWDLQHPDSEPRMLRGSKDRISGIKALAFDTQERWLATGSMDGTVSLLDLNPKHRESEWRVQREGEHEAGISTVAFHPQARWLAIGSGDGTIRLWDIQHPELEARVLGGHKGEVEPLPLAFDAQGRWLATGSRDGPVRLWDLQHPASEPRVLRGHGGGILALGFHPQGRWLATGSLDVTAMLWDLEHPESKPWVLRGHYTGIRSLGFDPQGRWLATGAPDNTARLWDLQRRGAEPRVLLRAQQDRIWRVAVDPQGRWLATGSRDGSVLLWQLDTRLLLDFACRTAGRNLTQEEWRQYVGESMYQVTCPQFPSGETVAKEGDRPAH